MSAPLVSQPRPWQAAITDGLVRDYQAAKLHHSLLLQGPQFIGKQHFAHNFAGLLLCERAKFAKPGAEKLPYCGVCQSCTLYEAGTHPDFLVLGVPEGKKYIPVDVIRSAQGKLQQKALMGSNKVCLIYPAEALNENSANALLKLLEEPPPQTYFLLVAHSPQAILATIKSRCLPVKFGVPTQTEIQAWLSDQFEAQDISYALELSRGFPEKALEFLSEKGDLHQYQQLAERFLSTGHLSPELLAEIEKTSLETFLDTLLYQAHKLWDANGVLGAEQKLSSRIIAAKAALQSNPNKKLFLEAFFLELTQS